MKNRRICFICSRGGHLTDLEPLIEELGSEDSFLVTEKAVDTENLADYYITPFHRMDNIRGIYPTKLLKNIIQSTKIILKERPKYVISTGAIMCVPLIYLSKIFGSKIIYIECSNRVTQPSYTGRVVYPVSDYFFLQWKSLLKRYGKKARYRGNLIS